MRCGRFHEISLSSCGLCYCNPVATRRACLLELNGRGPRNEAAFAVFLYDRTCKLPRVNLSELSAKTLIDWSQDLLTCSILHVLSNGPWATQQ